MNLAELFGPMGLVVPFAPVDKWEAIGELVQQTVARGSLTPRQGESALEAVLRRERSMSTGMEKGIAIPHAAMDGLSAPVACLGITPAGKGIAFESMDGAPAELVVLLLIPKDQKLLHIRTLAEVARVLGDPAVRATLSAATTPEEAFAALDRGFLRGSSGPARDLCSGDRLELDSCLGWRTRLEDSPRQTTVLFYPDVLAGQLPATPDQVRQLALRAMIANRQAGRGFGVLEFVLDGYGDWIQRRDRAFADGLFVSLLDDLVRGESALVCGMRTGGRATLFLQSLTQAQLGVVAQGWSRRAQAMSFASRGGPDRLTVSMGAAHLEGYRSTDAPCQLEDLEFAARRGARLVGRTGGSQFALIERFGGAPPESIGLAPSQVHAEPDRSLDTASKADGAPSPQPVQPKAVPAPTPEELERTLAARYGEAFARLLEGRDLEWERRVQLLEKRLEKLGLMVDSAARAAMQPAADTGVASRFQTVQGLTQDDELFESKQGLMSAIYQANLEIRQRLKGRSVG